MAKQLGRDRDERNYASDEFLKIPQLYFNQRGASEYFQRIESHFDSKAEPNAIHRLLLELGPSHIITTNYDSLIERQAALSDVPYHTVRCDSDLTFARFPRLIVKMHGDIGLRNIVLKENDYLSYSNNFRFIDIVVKSLFATNLVIFIGFSATDPNFNIIYQWVKDALKGEVQPAYLLQLTETFDLDEFQYFKAKGINIIYWSLMETSVRKWKPEPTTGEYNSLQPPGRNLYLLLDYIRTYRNVDPIAWAFDLLMPLDSVPALLPQHVEDTLNDDHNRVQESRGALHVYERDLVEFLKTNTRYSYIKNLLKDRPSVIRLLRNVVSKASISRVLFEHTEIAVRELPSIWEESELYRLLMRFDFVALENLVDQAPIVTPQTDNISDLLKQAFLLAIIGRMLDAYNVLQRVSSIALKQKDDWSLLVSYFNRRHVSGILWVNLLNFRLQPADIRDTVYREREVSLKQRFGRSLGEKGAMSHLLDDMEGSQFIRRTLEQIEKVTADHIKLARQLESGAVGWINPDPLLVGNFLMESLQSFIFRNYLLTRFDSIYNDLYREYCRGRFIRYGAESVYRRKGKLANVIGNVGRELDYFVFAFAIQHIGADAIDEIMHEANITMIDAGEEISGDLIRAFNNLITFGINVQWESRLFFFDHYFTSFLTIFYYLKLSASDTSAVVTDLMRYANAKQINKRWLGPIRDLFHRKKDDFKDEDLPMIAALLNTVVRSALILDSKTLEDSYGTVEILSAVLERVPPSDRSDFVSPSIRDVTTVIDNWKDYSSSRAAAVIYEVLIPIYRLMPVSIQTKISSFITESLSAQWHFRSGDIFFFATIDGLITPDVSLISRFISETYSFASGIANDETAEQVDDRNAEIAIEHLAILIGEGKIRKDILKDKLEAMSELNKFMLFVLKPNSFDYDTFSLSWLTMIPVRMVRRIAKSETKRQSILRIFRSSSTRDTLNDKVASLVFQYFIGVS
jgi:hypothetical protein